MARPAFYLSITIIFVITPFLFQNCKKEKEKPLSADPTFIITADSVNLVSGDKGLQFFATSVNVNIKMTKVVITEPVTNRKDTFNLNGAYFDKNVGFGLQPISNAYIKQLGIWKFNLIGNRPTDGVLFDVNEVFNVNK